MRWRDLSAENETVFSEVLRLRLSWNTAKYADNERIDMALEKVNARINRARRYRIARSLLKYAAVILLLVSFSAVGWNYFKPETYMTIALGDSEGVKKVTLDDGSIVWLRGNSVLKIPQSFSAVNRTVSLQGEAFFDIAKNANSLFIVATDYVKVEVHGTSFHVNVNAGNKSVETASIRRIRFGIVVMNKSHVSPHGKFIRQFDIQIRSQIKLLTIRIPQCAFLP